MSSLLVPPTVSVQDGEAVRKRVRRVPDHQDRAVAEGAQDGFEETHFVVGIEMRRGFVEEQDARAAKEFARQSVLLHGEARSSSYKYPLPEHSIFSAKKG